MFNQLIEKLRLELKKPLPGIEAQSKMAPAFRITDNYNPNPYDARKGSVLILLYPFKSYVFLSFIRRAANGGSHSGQMALPGGKYDKEDGTLYNTALRETEEEIGIPPADVTIIGELTQLYIPPSNFAVLPVVGYITYRPDFNINPSEVQRIIEMDLADLCNPKNQLVEDVIINDVLLEAPFYNANGHHIWGATAMIISEFLEVVKATKLYENCGRG